MRICGDNKRKRIVTLSLNVSHKERNPQACRKCIYAGVPSAAEETICSSLFIYGNPMLGSLEEGQM